MKKLPTPSVQGELLDRRVDTTFTHLFNAIFSTGDAREMGETAFMVLCCIKSYASLNTGQSFPSMDTVAEKIGKSRDTVERSIKKLVEMEYVQVCGKKGRNNVYKVKERFPITNRDGEMVEAVRWDYVPMAVSEVQRQVRQYVEKGRVEGQQTIHIEKIEVNINYGTQIETQIVSENVQMNGSYDVQALRDRMQSARAAEFEKISRLIPGVKLRGKV